MSLLPVSREVEDVCVSTAAKPTNEMKKYPSTKLSAKSSRARSNCSAARLSAYLTAGIGTALVATPQADAAIVLIDITSFGLDGPNAGVSPESSTDKPNFPISGGWPLAVSNSSIGMGFYGRINPLGPSDILYFAAGLAPATPVNFTLNQSISSSANWEGYPYSLFMFLGTESPDFGSGSYMGFKTAQGNFGWLEVTWARATDTFQIYSGAYESTAGVAIAAGATAAVPEPSTIALLALGAAGVAIQRRRAKKKQAAVVA